MKDRDRDDKADRLNEEASLVRSLRHHRRVIDADREDVPLPEGVTHVLVSDTPGAEPRLVERRKSFF